MYKVLRVTDGRVLAGKVSEAAAKMKEAGILQSLHHVRRPLSPSGRSPRAEIDWPTQHHILQFVDWHEEPGNAAASLLITELCGHGTLQTRIDHAAPSMDGGEILLAVRQVGDALAYLHERQLFHTDVKARNILVRGLAPLDVVLGDCGDVRSSSGSSSSNSSAPGRRGRRGDKLRGTPAYYSPDMVRLRRHVGPGDDVWALGVTLLGMAAQWPALRRGDGDELRALNPRHGLVALLARMLEHDAAARAVAGECADGAPRLLREREAAGATGPGLGIKAPADFRPASFW